VITMNEKTGPELGAASSWTPTNYIVNGQFTETTQLQAALEEIRQDTGCQIVLSFVSSPIHIDSTLAFAASDDTLGDSMAEAIRGSCNNSADAIDLWDILLALRNRAISLLQIKDMLEKLPVFHFLHLFFRDRLDQYADTSPLEIVVLNLRSDSDRFRHRTSVTESGSPPDLLLSIFMVGSVRQSPSDISLQRFKEMILTSLPLTMERQKTLTERLLPFQTAEQQFEYAFDSQTSSRLDSQVYYPLLNTARLTLRCEHAGLFVFSEVERFSLDLHRYLQCECATDPTYLDLIDWTDRSIIWRSFRTGRPHIEQNNLAVPVFHRPLRARAPRPMGVLHLIRQPGNGNLFALPDLLLTQEIAQRIATLRVRNRVYSFLTNMAIGHRSVQPNLTDMTYPRVDSELNADTDMSSLIPWDLGAAQEAVAKVVHDFQELTGALTVTVRLFSVDQQTLIPFAIARMPQLNRSLRAIPFDPTRYLSAHVVWTGKAIIASQETFPGFHDEEPLKPSPLACCSPLFVDGRIVGTLSATADVDRVSDLEGRITIGSWRISSELAAARKRVSDKLLKPALEVSYALHTLRSNSSGVKGIIRNSDFRQFVTPKSRKWIISDLTAIARAYEHVVSIIEDSDSDQSSDTVTLYDVAKRLKAALAKRGKALKRTKQIDLTAYVFDHRVAQSLAKAMEQILQNVPKNAIAIWRVDRIQHAGRPYVRIRTRTPQPVHAALLPYLYQTPFVTDRLHLGSYLAAAFLHTVGGHAFVGNNSHEEGFQTVVEVPEARP